MHMRPFMLLDLSTLQQTFETLSAHLAHLDSLVARTGMAEVYKVPVVRDDRYTATLRKDRTYVEPSFPEAWGTMASPLQVCIEPVPSSGPPAPPPRGRLEKPPETSEVAALWDTPIPVDYVRMPQALSFARTALRTLVRRVDQPPTRIDRLPGLLYCTDPKLPALVGSINAAKAHFAHILEELHASRRQLDEAFEGTPMRHVLLLNVYRRLTVLEQDIEAVSFGWSGASRTVQCLTREQAVRLCQSGHTLAGKSQWQKQIENCSDRYFARVRRQAPFPVVNIRIDGVWQPRQAVSLPLLVAKQVRIEKIRALSAYVPGVRPGDRRGDQLGIQAEPFIEPLRLYRYKNPNSPPSRANPKSAGR